MISVDDKGAADVDERSGIGFARSPSECRTATRQMWLCGHESLGLLWLSVETKKESVQSQTRLKPKRDKTAQQGAHEGGRTAKDL